MDQLRVLETFDESYMPLSVSTIFAYWKLREANKSFADVEPLYATLSSLTHEAFAAQAFQLRSIPASSYRAL
jgi:hypothetical protein